jgi:hypothetical protein
LPGFLLYPLSPKVRVRGKKFEMPPTTLKLGIMVLGAKAICVNIFS